VHAVLAVRDRLWIVDSARSISALRRGRVENVIPASAGYTAAGRGLAEAPDGNPAAGPERDDGDLTR